MKRMHEYDDSGCEVVTVGDKVRLQLLGDGEAMASITLSRAAATELVQQMLTAINRVAIAS